MSFFVKRYIFVEKTLLIIHKYSLLSYLLFEIMKKKNFDDFLSAAKEVHGNKFIYDESTYKDTHTKMRIICPEHGEFWQSPKSHLLYDCIYCSYEKRGEIFRKTTEDFIKKAKEIHGNKYDYSKVEYVTAKTPVCIICSEHGEFWQKPNDHLNGRGCPICKISHLECEVYSFLEKNNIEFEYQYSNEELKRQSLDFFIPKHNVAIECQGKQHFGIGGWFNDYDKLCFLDEQKFKICNMLGIKLYYQ